MPQRSSSSLPSLFQVPPLACCQCHATCQPLTSKRKHFLTHFLCQARRRAVQGLAAYLCMLH